MSARMDSPIECACDEMEALQTIEMMVRGLMAQQVEFPKETDKNQINSGYRLVFTEQLARIDAMRAIAHAKEQA